MMRQVSDGLCEEYGLSTLDGYNHKRYTKYKYFYQQKLLTDDYYIMAKEDLDALASESYSMKSFLLKLKQLGYEYNFKNNRLTIWKDDNDKIRVERAFGKDYSVESLNHRFSTNDYKPSLFLSGSAIYNNYQKNNKTHKGIYGLFLYYCYLLKVFPKEQPKQRLPCSIRKDIAILDQISNEKIFMADNKIEIYEDLMNFKNSNNSELYRLRAEKENLWKRYHRAPTEEKKVAIYNQLTDYATKIKELYKYQKYCECIETRSKKMQTNINELNNGNMNKAKEKEQMTRY